MAVKKTIDNYKRRFHERYPEYKDHKWTPEGMIYYVIAHEIAHLFSPEYLHGTVNEEIPRNIIWEYLRI